MSIAAYFICFLLGVIVIETIIITVMGFIIKGFKNKERRIFNQKLLDREGFKRTLKDKKDFYNEKARKAHNINDLLDLTDKLMSDGYHPA